MVRDRLTLILTLIVTLVTRQIEFQATNPKPTSHTPYLVRRCCIYLAVTTSSQVEGGSHFVVYLDVPIVSVFVCLLCRCHSQAAP